MYLYTGYSYLWEEEVNPHKSECLIYEDNTGLVFNDKALSLLESNLNIGNLILVLDTTLLRGSIIRSRVDINNVVLDDIKLPSVVFHFMDVIIYTDIVDGKIVYKVLKNRIFSKIQTGSIYTHTVGDDLPFTVIKTFKK